MVLEYSILYSKVSPKSTATTPDITTVLAFVVVALVLLDSVPNVE